MVIELNIALIPQKQNADQLIEISNMIAKKYPAIVRLEPAFTLSLAPHLTLYQVPLGVEQLETASGALAQIAAHTAMQSLVATKYAYNDGEASFELQRETTEPLVRLQSEVLDALNPLRGERLIQRDPSGATITELTHADDPLGTNIRQFGYAEVGPLFRPHDTLNWLTPGSTTTIETSELPDPSTINGIYDAIGMFVLGPHGTCPQLLARYALAGNSGEAMQL